MDMKNLKAQHQMTREDLIDENRKLRMYIDQLETRINNKIDVFQEGSLTEIIEACTVEARKENQQKKTSFASQKTGKKNKSLEDLMEQYSKYRKVFGEKPASREVSINLKSIFDKKKINF